MRKVQQVALQSAGNESISSPQQLDDSLRPQLIRIDSRSTLTPRPAFLNPIKPTQQARPPPNNFPFLQRPAPTVPRIGAAVPNTFQQNQINSPRFQFQRPQNFADRPPSTLLQHRPDNHPRPSYSVNLPTRSLNPDSSETNFNLTSTKYENKNGANETPLIKKNENFSSNSTIGDTIQSPFNVQPRHINSTSNMEDNVVPIKVKSSNLNTEVISEPKLFKNNPPYVMANADKNITQITEKTEVNQAKLELAVNTGPNNLPSEGDNDSGVDEVTEGNAKNDNVQPNRSAKSSVAQSTALSKNRSFSRGDKSPSLKSPGFLSSDATSTEKKKLPMNKIQVGSAASPNLKVVKSKIGSLQNATYKPGGGNIKIEHRKMDFSTTSSRITAKNENYTPRGGDKKIQQQKLTWNAKSKIGSLENASHKPQGGDKKIENLKLDFKDKAKSRVGSKDNIKYSPGGGDVKIENKKLEIKGQSKIGSLDNIKHKPGGGDKKIYEDKNYIRQMSAHSNVSLNDSHNSSQTDVREPASDENLNQQR